jgi:catechol 2,3-dioxygenase-like lactoylglutathione lyase family enzyme
MTKDDTMKRFHAHVAVSDIGQSIAFYTNLFGLPPIKEQADYAKWELNDPRVNFAISARGHTVGLNHFGFQAETPDELSVLKLNADAASSGEVVSEEGASCCYAKSDKHWTVDPQGIAWENFLTMADAMEFGTDTAMQSGACCIPTRSGAGDDEAAGSACCIPNEATQASGCCG